MRHLSASPLANVYGSTSRGLTFKPPRLVFFRPSANVSNVFPPSSRLLKKKFYLHLVILLTRRPKCCVIRHHIGSTSERGLLPPNWLFSKAIFSSSFVRLLDRFGRFPFPGSLSFRAFPSNTFLVFLNALSRRMDFGTTSTFAPLQGNPARSHLRFPFITRHKIAKCFNWTRISMSYFARFFFSCPNSQTRIFSSAPFSC